MPFELLAAIIFIILQINNFWRGTKIKENLHHILVFNRFCTV